ncbi:MAG: STAS domain-containing protein [Acidimicrobiales bacterium]
MEHLDGGALVRVAGEVDMSTAPRLESQLLGLAENGGALITVDLAETDFLDTTGLNALVVAVKHVRTRGGDLVLRAPSRPVTRVLELSGLATVVRVV